MGVKKLSVHVKHEDILIRTAIEECLAKVKHADILIRCARKNFRAPLNIVQILSHRYERNLKYKQTIFSKKVLSTWLIQCHCYPMSYSCIIHI